MECYYGKGERRRLIGYLETVGGQLRYRKLRQIEPWEIDYNNLLRNGDF